MLFESWDTIWRTLLTGVMIYVGVVLMLRISGKRTLAKWNAFDFIVTVALGSIVATVITSKTTTVAQGGAALGILILLQFIVTFTAVRAEWFRRLIKADPALLLYRGRFQQEIMKVHRVTRSEILAAIRASGNGSYSNIYAVVLETDGEFSVIPDEPEKDDAMEGVESRKDEG